MTEGKVVVRPWLVATIALTIVAALYVPALSASFVWDDKALIFDDPMVTKVQAPQSYLLAPFWAEGAELRSSRDFYRPLVTFSLALDHAVHGQVAAGYHLTNLLAHLVVCALLFALVRRAGASPPLAGLVTVAWGAAPRLAECVAWISGRTDVFAAAFSLGALLVWRIESPRRRWLAAGLVLLGLLAKEVAIAVWLALVVDCLLARRPKRAVPLGAALAVYAALRFAALQDRPPAIYPDADGAAARALLALEAAGRYALLVVDPWQPRLQIGLARGARSAVFVAAGALAAAALVGVVAAAARRRALDASRRDLFVPLTIAVAALALVLHLIPLPVNVVCADRFLYLPTAALLLLATPWIERATERWRGAWVVAALLALSVAAVGRDRVVDWSDDARLWTKAVRNSPADDALPHNALGNVYFDVAEYEAALREYGLALDADRRIGEAPARSRAERGNYANALAKLGRYDEALRRRSELVAEVPNVPRYHLDLANDALRVGEYGTARAEADVAVALMPTWTEAEETRARIDALAAEAPAVLAADPRAHDVIARRARVLVGLGRRPEALEACNLVVGAPGVASDDVFEAVVYLAREAPLVAARDAVDRAAPVVGAEKLEALRDAFAARVDRASRLRAAESSD